MQQIDMSVEKPMVSAVNPPRVRYSAAYPTMRRRKLCFRRGAARSAPEGTTRGRARSVCCGGKRKRLRQSSVTLLLPE